MSIEQQLAEGSSLRDAAVTIGTFDGVHRGHKQVFQRLAEAASASGLQTIAVTFRNHPRTVLVADTNVNYITSWVERQALIKCEGVDTVVALDFTEELSLLKARKFVGMLKTCFRMKVLVVGPDFALGYRREGDISALKAFGDEMDFRVEVVEPEMSDSRTIRSRTLRQLIAGGDVYEAAAMLGRRFSITGKIIEGDGRGRDLGFPTANLDIEAGRLVPGDGIYATWAIIGGSRYKSATSIGVRPTFGTKPRAVETFIIDFDDEVYSEALTLEFVSRLREELAFPSVKGLIEQMHRDVEEASAILVDEVK